MIENIIPPGQVPSNPKPRWGLVRREVKVLKSRRQDRGQVRGDHLLITYIARNTLK